jgi:hypothetical protein
VRDWSSDVCSSDLGRLAAAITPGLGITPKTEALGQAMFEVG